MKSPIIRDALFQVSPRRRPIRIHLENGQWYWLKESTCTPGSAWVFQLSSNYKNVGRTLVDLLDEKAEILDSWKIQAFIDYNYCVGKPSWHMLISNSFERPGQAIRNVMFSSTLQGSLKSWTGAHTGAFIDWNDWCFR